MDAQVGKVLYDEQADPTETVSLADKPEHAALLATLAKQLPPVGGDLNPSAKPKGKGKAAPAASTDERGARFDKDEAGKLTREYYTTHQSDTAAAAERFDKYDTDKDGLLSREEFIGRGKQPEN